jgi:WD40 repeat protein
VFSVAISQDGKYIVSGSADNSIKIWNIQERREECSLTGHTNAVYSVAISQDGKYIVSGSVDKSIKIWNIQERREECSLTGHTKAVYSVAISQDGKYIVSGSDDKCIKIWNIQERREECSLTGHTNYVSSVAISQDGKYIIIKFHDNAVKIWNCQQMKEESNPLKFIEETRTNIFSTLLSQLTHSKLRKSILLNASNNLIFQSTITFMNYPTLNSPYLYHKLLYTEDNLFGLHYCNNKLTTLLQFEPNTSPILSNFYGPQSLYDNFYQKPIESYNIIDYIKSNGKNISTRYTGIIFSEYCYTIMHFFAFKGLTTEMIKMFNDSFVLKADIFGKSPFYYAIIKKHQDLVNNLLEFISSLFSNSYQKTMNFQTLMHSLKVDFPLIIKNSSKNLPIFLGKLLISSNIIFSKINNDLPMFQYYESYIPQINDFNEI